MYKILHILMFLLFIFFFLNVYNYYSSNKNIDTKMYNRSNVDNILKKKISNLPVLENDTNTVIEFNDSYDEEIKNNKKRNFWNLLKLNEK